MAGGRQPCSLTHFTMARTVTSLASMQNGFVRMTLWGASAMPSAGVPPFSLPKPYPILPRPRVKPSGGVFGTYTSPSGQAGTHWPASHFSMLRHVTPAHGSEAGAAEAAGAPLPGAEDGSPLDAAGDADAGAEPVAAGFDAS